jgi:glycosyltransferase involved in cell wall biosynthesis
MYPRPHHPAGGIFVHEQVRALRARGIDARVVSGDPFWVQTYNPRRFAKALRAYHHNRPTWIQRGGVPVLHFPYLCGIPFRAPVHSLTYLHGFKKVLADVWDVFPFDLIHAHTSYLDGSAGLHAARAHGRPLLITEHTGPFEILTQNFPMRYMTRRSVTGANRVFAVSKSLKRDMLAALTIAPETIDVMPNGVDLDTFRPDVAASGGEPGSQVRALWVGHHVAVKQVERLVQAFAGALRERPSLRLSLLGDGPDRGRMETLVAELGLTGKVEFLPAADRAGVAGAMRAHDFLVIASATETFGLVALEALACGVPVLSTACGGPQDLITEPWIGLIVSDDVAGLVGGLVAMADRAGTFDPVRLHAHVRDRYSWDSIARRLIDGYQSMLGSQPHHG